MAKLFNSPVYVFNESSLYPIHSLSPLTTHEDSYSSYDGVDYDDASGSLSEGDDDLQVISALLPVSKRRQRPSRRKAFPRIIKQDIRRHYGQMLINVLNSHDRGTIDAFLGRYALPSITLTKQVNRSCTICRSYLHSLHNHDDIPESVDILVSGREKISRYWQLLLSLVPDQFMRVKDVNISRHVHSVADPSTGKVRLVNDDDTKVVCEWEGRATQIYEVSPPCFAYTAIGGQLSGTSSDDPTVSAVATSVSSGDELFLPTKKQRLDESGSGFICSSWQLFTLQRRPVTFQVSLRGRLVIEVDREFRLKKIDFGTVDVTVCNGAIV